MAVNLYTVCRDPVEWLRNSWEDQDVVVEFFRKGQYTAKQRAQAEGEFVRAASILATSANDDGMKKWAMDLMHDQFEVSCCIVVK